jgi:hypothetical protein
MDSVKNALLAKGLQCEGHLLSEFNLTTMDEVNPKLKTYLETCLTPDGFTASGVRVHDFYRILAENQPEVTPGGVIFPLSYIVFASSIGGNALAADLMTGEIFWIDSSNVFSDIDGTFIVSDDLNNPYPQATRDNVRTVMKLLAQDPEAFFVDLITDRLESLLDELD